MPSTVCSCPAKINFGLQVKYRRPDGYHEIESVFLPVDFADTLEIRSWPERNPEHRPGDSPDAMPRAAPHAAESQLTTENLIPVTTGQDFEAVSERGNPRNNLVLRVLDCVNAQRSIPIALSLHLKKRVPSGAGLGGGSSDAGTLLRWLRDTGRISNEQAFACAKATGADIPFFLDPVPSIVTGIGDFVRPVDNERILAGLRKMRGILALSSLVIPTKNAYTELKRHLQSASDHKSGSGSERALQALLDADGPVLAEVRNDFEEFAFRLHPELERVKGALQKCEAVYASMTGSGSAIYGLFPSIIENKTIALLEAEFPDFRFVQFRFQF